MQVGMGLQGDAEGASDAGCWAMFSSCSIGCGCRQSTERASHARNSIKQACRQGKHACAPCSAQNTLQLSVLHIIDYGHSCSCTVGAGHALHVSL